MAKSVQFLLLVFFIFCSFHFVLADEMPSTDLELFKNMSEASYSVGSYGNVPLMYGSNANIWWESLNVITQSIQEDQALADYSASNGGPVIGYGCKVDGFIIVYLNADAEKNIQDIENMQQIIDAYAQKYGIHDVPIIFANSRNNLVLDPDEKYSLQESKSISSVIINFFKKFLKIEES